MAKDKQVEVLVITPTNVKLKVIENDYRAFKKELNINSPLDCIQRTIGSKRYDIWLDDEGLFNQNADGTIGSIAINTTWEEFLAGNLIIANHDEEGYTLSLSDEDIENVKKHISIMREDTTIAYNTNIGLCYMKFKKGNHILVYSDERE